MKKIFMILAVVQMMICSCMKPEIENTQIKTPAAGEVVFTAVIEQTKALPAAGGIVSWTENEEIGVYDGTSYVKATVLGVEGNSITFSAAVDPDAASYVAINPYEAGAAGDGQTINFAAVQAAGKHVVSIALFTDAEETVSFKNVGNLLRFKVNKAAVKKAKIVGNNAEKLAGNVTANAETGEATGTLTEAEIVTDITPGVDSFIALAPGVSLPDGFTITLYGDEDCTDYQGEVSSAAPLDFTGEKARNQMRNLGLIDGWIDNYKLWQAGKPITIAGEEYSKETTGFDGKLISAEDADVDIANRLSSGALDPNAYFLETYGTSVVKTSAWYNIGYSTPNTVLLISRYDNVKAKFAPTQRIVLYNGNFAAKGIDFDITNSAATYYFQGYTVADFGNFHLDACNLALDAGDKILYFYTNGSNDYKAVKSIKIVNSKIKSRVSNSAKIDLVYASSAYKYLDKWEEFIFQNNVLYNATPTGTVCLLNAAGATATNIPTTILKVENNTFYNMHGNSQYVIGYSLGSLSFKGNLLYSTDIPLNNQGNKITTFFAQTSDTTYAYPYVFENNATNYAIYYFNINQPGVYGKDSPTKVTTFIRAVANATASTFFSKVDTENGIFTQTEAYAEYGAKQ